MKKILKLVSSISFAVLLLFVGCKDKTDITAPAPPSQVSGQADFTRFVTLGNSLTAGYESGSLYESAQKYSFGNLIAGQLNASFAQPLFSEPGTPGRLEVKSLEPFNLFTSPGGGQPMDLNYPAPYNNLGVPGAFVYDIMNATNSNDCYTGKYANSPNPLFDAILRGLGTPFHQAQLLHPTFMTVWIGNNDILGYATSGGTKPYTPTAQFDFLYSQMMDSVASLGAKVVVANIPDVGAIPFFTTVGPQVSQLVTWSSLKLLGVPGLVFQKNGETIGTGVADSTALLTGKVLITLPGSAYATLLGKSTGKFYRDNGYPALPAGIDTTKPFGFHPQNPWPDALILDADEITTTRATVASYNQSIATAVAKHNFGLVDIYSFFNGIRAKDFSGGTKIDGIDFTTMYVEGGIFSLDGVHPTSQGYGIVANEFIKVINSKYSANIPLINVSEIPGSLIFAKKSLNKLGLPNLDINSFKNFVF